MTKGELFLKKHSSTILTFISAAGVITTTVLAVKATPKALELIEEERQSRKEYGTIFADNCSYETTILPDLTPLEIIKVAWKPYIPTMISGVSTIACIFGVNYLNKRTQASLLSAYALLDNTYKEYRNKTKEICPEESTNIEHEIIKSKYNPSMRTDEDKELFYDIQSMRYFESTFENLKYAETAINQQLCTEGYACLNDFYDYLHERHVPYGYQLGWSTINSDRMYAHDEILLEFDYDKIELDDGLECNIMTIKYSPELEYMS